MPSRELTTERLHLRAWTAADADFLFDMCSRMEVMRYIGTPPRVMADRAEADARIAAWLELDHPVHARWAATRRSDGALLGNLLLKAIPASGGGDSGDTEIGWHLHPDAWGQGYATEAAAAVLAYAFASGLDRVIAVTDPANLPSQRVCLRIGMRALGETARYYDTTCRLFDATNDAPNDAATPRTP